MVFISKLGFGLLIFMIISNPVLSQVKKREFFGYAFDLKTNQFLYKERYIVTYENQRLITIVVIYTDIQNQVIGKKVSNYQRYPTIPLFQLEYYRNGYTEGSLYEDNGFRVFYQDKGQPKKVSKLFPFDRNISLDSGLHPKIQMHFDDLLKGKSIKLNFAVPSQLDILQFRLYKQKEWFLKERKTVRLILEIDNFFLRFLVEPVILDYDIQTKELVQYIGISNLYDENNKPYKVKIIFDHEGDGYDITTSSTYTKKY